MDAAPRSLTLGFAGTPRFALPALDALCRSTHRVVAVLTQPDRPAGRGQSVRPGPIAQRARELELPLHQPASLKTPEAAALLRSLELDALVVVAYGLILPALVLEIPRLGCFNIHASLLPRWRGAAPIQRALLAGDTLTGVCIMRLQPGLDTGPVLAVRTLPLVSGATAGEVHDTLAAMGGELIVAALDAVAAGSAREQPQPDTGVTYAAKIVKSEALIDWSDDARHIARQVGAFNPWPIAETRWQGAQLRIWEAEALPAASLATGTAGCAATAPGTVIAAASDGVDVACGHGVLRVRRLQLAGRKPLPASEFIKAHRLEGARLAAL